MSDQITITAEDLKPLNDKIDQVFAMLDHLVGLVGRDYLNLAASSFGESDRGAVLMLHSAVDEALQELILGFLKRHAPEAHDEQLWLVSIEKNQVPPLGGYGVKTRFCYAAGLIDKELKGSLSKLAKIRNPFAHNWTQSVSLQDSHIDSLLAMVAKEERDLIASLSCKDEKERKRLILIGVYAFILEKICKRIHAVTGNPASRLPKPSQKIASPALPTAVHL